MKYYMYFDRFGNYAGSTTEKPVEGPVVVEGQIYQDPTSPTRFQKGIDCTFWKKDAIREWIVVEGPLTVGDVTYQKGDIYKETKKGYYTIQVVPHNPEQNSDEFCSYCGMNITQAGGRVGFDCPHCQGN